MTLATDAIARSGRSESGRRALACDAGRFLRPAQAARHVARRLHRAASGSWWRPARIASGDRLHLDPLRSRSAPAPPGALNMWYDADIDAVMSRTARTGPIPAGRSRRGEALGFGARAVGRLGHHPRPRRQLVGRRAARLHHLLLRRRLHDVAEALDAAEHRHRRRRRRLAAGDRLGGGHRRRRRSRRSSLFAIIFLWTPPHFWALALTGRATTRAPAPDAAGRRGRARDASGRSLIYTLLLVAGRRSRPAARLWRPGSTASSRLLAGRGFAALAVQLFRSDGDEATQRAAQQLFGFSMLYLFLIFARPARSSMSRLGLARAS